MGWTRGTLGRRGTIAGSNHRRYSRCYIRVAVCLAAASSLPSRPVYVYVSVLVPLSLTCSLSILSSSRVLTRTTSRPRVIV